MTEPKPLRCKKCGRPIGYITLTTKSLLGTPQPAPNLKIDAVCMNCRSPKFTVP
jgi:hypothetical protein